MNEDRELEKHGILPAYPGSDGRPVPLAEETRRVLLEALEGWPVTAGDAFAAPALPCYFPDWLRERRAWGFAVQLYELRSRRDWGIGDFADLAAFCTTAGSAGADFVGLNPLHALFLADPARCSPFAPSNRRFLNPLYIAVDKVEGFEPAREDEAEIERLRATPLVDYAGVAALKLAALRRIWDNTAARDAEGLSDFAQDGGAPLLRHATFEALSLALTALGRAAGWKDWPQGLQDAASEEVATFARENRDEIQFHIWLQWLARRQLAQAAESARMTGMRIGLYLDFAVGEAPDGSATWSDPGLSVGKVKIGAPPDVFSAEGQDWGLAPLSPRRLAEDGFQPYRELMGAAMLDAGALRLDHAMSLRRLFWIPEDLGAADGGYVLYPMKGILNVLAGLSRERQAVLIGEDLGHVPDGFREEMEAAGIFSYRILPFERGPQGFRPPRAWPALALACLSTHDLPTLKGWWQGSDIELRGEYGLIDGESAGRQRRERARERRQLLHALSASAVIARSERRGIMTARRMEGEAFERLAVAAHRFIARTPCRLAGVRLADAVGEAHPTNLPGTYDQYPNWRRKLDVPLERLEDTRLFRLLTVAMAKERPR